MGFQMKEVHIRPVLNGWVAKIGCSEVVFTDAEVMNNELFRYISDPLQVEEEYQKGTKNKRVVELCFPEADCRQRNPI